MQFSTCCKVYGQPSGLHYQETTEVFGAEWKIVINVLEYQ